jgi:hypothetical protein
MSNTFRLRDAAPQVPLLSSTRLFPSSQMAAKGLLVDGLLAHHRRELWRT